MNASLRVLLVDDNPDDRVMVERRLRREFPDLQVEQAVGAAGFDRAIEARGFDLVITDYRLRWSDGIKVMRAVKARMPDCLVIMFTATGSEDVAVESMKNGLDDYVVKSPRHMVRLVAAVRAGLERVRQRAAFRDLEERHVRLFENVPVGLFRTTADGRILDVNPMSVEMFRYPSREQMLALDAVDLYENPADRERFKAMAETAEVVRGFEVRLRRRDGTIFWGEMNVRALRDAAGQVVLFEGSTLDVSERKQAEEALRAHQERLERLQGVTQAALEAPDFEGTLQAIAARIGDAFGAYGCYIGLWDEAGSRVVPAAAAGPQRETYPKLRIEPGEPTLTASALRAGRVLAVEDTLNSPLVSARIARLLETRSALVLPLFAGGQGLGAITVAFDRPHSFTPDEIARAEQAAGILSLAVTRARLLDLTRRHADSIAARTRLLEALLGTWDLNERLRRTLDWAIDFLGAQMGGIFLLEGGVPVPKVRAGVSADLLDAIRALPADVLTDLGQRVQIIREPLDEQGRMFEFAKREGIQVWAGIPFFMPAGQAGTGIEDWRGTIVVASRDLDAIQEDKVAVVEEVSPQVALAVAHAHAYLQAQDRLARLRLLHSIDLAITSSLDLRVTLAVLLSEVVGHLRVDAAAVLLFGRHTHVLEYAAVHGFATGAHRNIRLRLGEGPAGRAALERRTISIPDRLADLSGPDRSPLAAGEGFVAQIALPLIAKGLLRGVLELSHRTPFTLDPEWLAFLESLAAQAAIAVDDAVLYGDLQRSSADLALAYEATLEGWVRGLDLRDKETEGHTRRVVEMTLSLAARLGVPEADLAHVRRGALLHDIGKIGIPDAILLKPGPLDDEEWAVMRRHPVYAYEMLSGIPFLRPALDIPRDHHEKWDGTGYPRGLRGEQIPLAARIFAVVDVWDALRSDRPYRKAWDEERARAYIREQSGEHFDPRVVEAFLKMLEE